MAPKKTNTTERPKTVEDHKATVNRHSNVNEALGFPTGDSFENDLTAILESDAEANGEIVAIALFDMDCFDHINKDFGVEAGDKMIIETGRYIKETLGKNACVYRIGGDEFGAIFRGTMEREEIFLLLNDLKNNNPVKDPSGEQQSLTVGMATAFEDASRCAELVRKADGALYRAKVSGRNKIAMAKEEKMVPKTSHYTQDQLQRLAKLSKREGVGEAILLREALDMMLKKYDV